MNSSNLRNMARGRSVRGAFTLIELLLVMVIIAILAGILLPKVTGRMQESKINAAKGQLSMLKTALGMFEIDNGRYPTTEEGLGALVTNPGNLTNWHKTLDSNTVPIDPWGNPYVYRCPGSDGPDSYDLSSNGPSGRQGAADNIKSQ